MLTAFSFQTFLPVCVVFLVSPSRTQAEARVAAAAEKEKEKEERREAGLRAWPK